MIHLAERRKALSDKFFNKTFCIEVWGDYACFTRPEMKVERVSYDVITPSAARAVFEAIFWKPAVRWRVKQIEVLAPVRWISVRRNELSSVVSDRSTGILVEDARQQRAGLFLRDVRYRLHAELEFIPQSQRPETLTGSSRSASDTEERGESRKDENPGKYNAIFERRAKKGQCFTRPYLGCREFSCNFRLVEDLLTASSRCPPINETRDLGFMLYDLDFSDPDNPIPAFFRAQLVKGIVKVPDWESEEVRR